MPIPQLVAPRRGTIASRYLEAISCGGNDVSGLSMSSPKKWAPPENKQQPRKLQDVSCGMTAPTTALDRSASWTTVGTRSRSEVTSRSTTKSRSNVRRIRSAQPQVKLGMEDDCSSIESSSSHRRNRPAHMSLEMEDSRMLDSSSFNCSMNNSSFNSSFSKRRPSAATRGTPSRNPKGTTTNSAKARGVFHKTSPRKSVTQQWKERQQQQQDETLVSPYSMKRSGNLQATPGSELGETAPTEVMNNLSTAAANAKYRFQMASEGGDPARSEAGAATEIMTNRTLDVLSRQHPNDVPPAPTVRRRGWPPPEPSGKEKAMRSLMDDTSNEESAAAPPNVSLFDAPSSSMSAPTSPVDRSRLALHVHRSNSLRQPTEQDMASYNTGSSSIRVETGGGNTQPMLGNRAVFGGRQVRTAQAARARQNLLLRGLQPHHQLSKPLLLPPMQVQGNKQQQSDKMPPPAQQIEHNPSLSDEHTTGTSITDDLDVPDINGRGQSTSSKKFVVYNHRKKENADDVFQKRNFSETSTSASQPSQRSKLQQQERNSDLPHGKSPIQRLFSLDRVDFSFDSQSPLRKWRSRSFTKKNSDTHNQVGPPKRSKSEAAPRRTKFPPVAKEGQPDPIFCPESMSFASNDILSPSSVLSPISQTTRQSVEEQRKDNLEMKRSVIMAWPAPEENSDVVEEELVHIMDKTNQRRSGSSRPTESARNLSTTGILEDLLEDLEGRLVRQRNSNSSPENTSITMDMAVGTVSSNTDKICAKKEEEERESVKDKIRAFNAVSPDKWHGTSKPLKAPADHPDRQQLPQIEASRQSLVMGSQLARLVYADEEKKSDEMSVDLSTLESQLSSIEREDDDTASVRSLREMWENNFGLGHDYFDPEQYEDDEDDDNNSVRSLRQKLEQRIQEQERIQDEDNDTVSVKSLCERFEVPQKRESGKAVSKIRAMFETNQPPAAANALRTNSPRATRLTLEPTASRPPTSITMKTKGRKGEAQLVSEEFQNAEVTSEESQNAGVTDTGKGLVPTPKLRGGVTKHSAQGGEKLETYRGVSPGSSSIAAEDLPTQQATPTSTGQQAAQRVESIGAATSPAQTGVSKTSHWNPEELKGAGNAAQRQQSASNSRTQFAPARQQNYAQTIPAPGPVVSPFLSMRDRLQLFTKSRNGSAFSAHSKKSTSKTMHDRLNRWANRHQVSKSSPLAAQAKSGGRINDINEEGAQIDRVESYDLSSVVSGEEVEPEAKPAGLKTRDLSKKSSKSFEEFFSRTNQQVRKRQNRREAKSVPTAKHASKEMKTKNAQLSSPLTSMDNTKPTCEPSADNKKDIFRLDGKSDKTADDSEQKAPGSHWVKNERGPDASMPQKNDAKGKSTETESDGVTLDLSIADVSIITTPSAIQSKGSKEIDRQSSYSSSIIELAAKKSEASSSQLSEAAAPLITGAMRLNPMSDEMSREIKHRASHRVHEAEKEKWTAKSEKDKRSKGNSRAANLTTSAPTKERGVGWDIQHLEELFPFKSPSSEDLFGVDVEEEGGSFPDIDWPAFDQDDIDWTNPTPSEATEKGRGSYLSGTRLTAGGSVVKSKEQQNQWEGLSPIQTVAQNRRTVPLKANRGSALTLVHQPMTRSDAVHHALLVDPVLTGNMPSGPGTMPLRPAVPPRAATVPIVPQRYPIESVQATNKFNQAGLKSERTKSQDHRPDSSPQRVGPQSDRQMNIASPQIRSPPNVERRQAHLPTTSSQLTEMPVVQHLPTTFDTTISQLPEMPVTHPLPSTFDEDYEAIMESRHKMLLSRQRAHQERRVARENAKMLTMSPSRQDPIRDSASPALRNAAEPPGSRMGDPPSATSQNGFFGRTRPSKPQILSRRLPTQHSADLYKHENGDIPIPNDYGSTRKTEPQSIRTEYGSKSTPDGNDYGPRNKAKVSANGDHLGSATPPEFYDYGPQRKKVSPTTQHRAEHSSALPNAHGEPSASFYARVTSSLGFSNNRGGSKHEALISRLKAVKTARLRRSTAMNAQSTSSSYRQQSGHPTQGASPLQSYRGQARGPESSSLPPQGPVSTVRPRPPSNYRDGRSREPLMKWTDEETSGSTKSNSQLYAAMLEVD